MRHHGSEQEHAAKREDRRRRERAQDLGDGPTFGEALAATGLLAVTSRATRSIIERAEAVIRDGARVQLSVVSCDTCTATKSCCTLRTTAWLHEAVPIADPEDQAILDGDALDIVVRKGEQNLRILTGNMPLTLLVPAALAFVIYVLARPTSWGSRSLQHAFDSVPTLRPGLIGLLVTLTIGFLINDSGVAIPAVGATVAVPLIVSVAVRSLVDEAQSGAPTRASRHVHWPTCSACSMNAMG